LAAVKAATFHSKNPLAMKMILTLAAAALCCQKWLAGSPQQQRRAVLLHPGQLRIRVNESKAVVRLE